VATDTRLSPAADPIEALAEHPARGRPRSLAAALEPLLVDIRGLSRLLSRSVASLWRDDAAGRLPAGLRIGVSKRWRYSEIVAWTEAGCPDRRTWEALRGTAQRNGRG
jgi:predicted DNA-binding transcriptional regulator AlpA